MRFFLNGEQNSTSEALLMRSGGEVLFSCSHFVFIHSCEVILVVKLGEAVANPIFFLPMKCFSISLRLPKREASVYSCSQFELTVARTWIARLLLA